MDAEANREQLQYVYNLLQRFKTCTLVLDSRPWSEFQALHLAGAVSLAWLNGYGEEISLGLIQKQLAGTEAGSHFARRKRLCVVICHSAASKELAMRLYDLLREDRCKELHLLEASIELFLGIYAFLSAGKAAKPIRHPEVGYPNEIIPGQLFLGDQHHAQCEDVLQHLGITHIVNATKTVHNRFPGVVQYCRIVVEDSDSEMICYHFNIAFRFMDHALVESERHKVLVHCAQGVSRSATLVIMYLMKKFDWSYSQAYDFAKKHRFQVQPNDGFIDQLREFEDARARFRAAQQHRKRLQQEAALLPRKEEHTLD